MLSVVVSLVCCPSENRTLKLSFECYEPEEADNFVTARNWRAVTNMVLCIVDGGSVHDNVKELVLDCCLWIGCMVYEFL